MTLPNRKQVCTQLTIEIDNELEKMAKGLDLSKSQIIRMLIKGAAEMYKREGVLPNWNFTQGVKNG